MPVMEPEKEIATEEAHGRHLGGRLIGFVKRRPILSMGLLAAGGALGGVEWAAGALLGLGAAALIATPPGRQLRRDLGDRARHLFERVEERVEEGRGGQQQQQQPQT